METDKRRIKHCKCCNTMFVDKTINICQKFCTDRCRDKWYRENMKQSKQTRERVNELRKKPQKKSGVHKKTIEQLEKLNMKAKAAGVDYGNYVAQHNLPRVERKW